jgi:hypothetical protein
MTTKDDNGLVVPDEEARLDTVPLDGLPWSLFRPSPQKSRDVLIC